MKAFKRSRVDKAIQLAELPTYRALHWYRDINGNVIKVFTQIKPYQQLKRRRYAHDIH